MIKLGPALYLQKSADRGINIEKNSNVIEINTVLACQYLTIGDLAIELTKYLNH